MQLLVFIIYYKHNYSREKTIPFPSSVKCCCSLPSFLPISPTPTPAKTRCSNLFSSHCSPLLPCTTANLIIPEPDAPYFHATTITRRFSSQYSQSQSSSVSVHNRSLCVRLRLAHITHVHVDFNRTHQIQPNAVPIPDDRVKVTEVRRTVLFIQLEPRGDGLRLSCVIDNCRPIRSYDLVFCCSRICFVVEWCSDQTCLPCLHCYWAVKWD